MINRTFTITIGCDNAAFDGDACGAELARILRALADDLAQEDTAFTAFDALLFDANGNRCGDAEMTSDEYNR